MAAQQITELDLRIIAAEQPNSFVVTAGHMGGGCDIYGPLESPKEAVKVRVSRLSEDLIWEVLSIQDAVEKFCEE